MAGSARGGGATESGQVHAHDALDLFVGDLTLLGHSSSWPSFQGWLFHHLNKLLARYQASEINALHRRNSVITDEQQPHDTSQRYGTDTSLITIYS